ncbi:MAG: hypothetical protein JKY96_00610 [Phycisphaerales bacterium]|nr:hypothetical protein [Phycisphaerales bacterium]
MKATVVSRNLGAKRGFTLVDLAAVLAVSISIAALAGPTMRSAQLHAKQSVSVLNLGRIGALSGMYALDNGGRIPTYTWRGPGKSGERVQYTLPNGRVKTMTNDQNAASWQNTAIIMGATGRFEGPFKVLNMTNRLSHRRFVHLVLWDYMGPQRDISLFADPSDRNLVGWQNNPLDYAFSGSGLPYSEGSPPAGYESDSSMSTGNMRMRWAFASSYMSTTSAYLEAVPNGAFLPIASTPHLFVGNPAAGRDQLHNGRFVQEVLFPSSKVYFYEGFDRSLASNPYFAYDFAAPNKLMFDGSINTQISGESRSSVSPNFAPVQSYKQIVSEGTSLWRGQYVPYDTFPIPVGGLGDNTELDFRYRWTYRGLSGIDYTVK